MRLLSRFIVATISILPKRFIWIFSKKYIAGEDIKAAVDVAGRLNKQGCTVTIDMLGEAVENIEATYKYKDTYLEIIESVEKNKINGNYSLKPTMFGLQIDESICYENIREIVKKASEFNNFVRIDMEDSSVTDKEIELYKKISAEFPHNVGIVFQAYLKRTKSDIELLCKLKEQGINVNIRLCKGIYSEPDTIAYKTYREIYKSFIDNLDFLLKNNIFTGIATHDKNIVKDSYKLIEKHNSKSYEFQMLYGVTPILRKQIIDNGHKMRIYVPFGKEWKKYSIRRFKENPQIIRHIIKAIFTKN